jgi:hypothetical protein
MAKDFVNLNSKPGIFSGILFAWSYIVKNDVGPLNIKKTDTTLFAKKTQKSYRLAKKLVISEACNVYFRTTISDCSCQFFNMTIFVVRSEFII